MSELTTFVIHPAAEEEAVEAARWYGERSARAAANFVDEVNRGHSCCPATRARWPLWYSQVSAPQVPLYPRISRNTCLRPVTRRRSRPPAARVLERPALGWKGFLEPFPLVPAYGYHSAPAGEHRRLPEVINDGAGHLASFLAWCEGTNHFTPRRQDAKAAE